MRPFGAWLGGFAMAGTCVMLGSGCGSGDVPDPASDSRAAPEPTARRGPAPREVVEPEADAAPGAAPKADPAALASNAPVPPAEKPAPTAPTEGGPKRDDRANDAEKPAPDKKGDASGTDDMMKMANNGAAPAPAGVAAPAAPNPPAGASPPTPSGSATPGGGAAPAGGERVAPTSDGRAGMTIAPVNPADRRRPGGASMPPAGAAPGAPGGGGSGASGLAGGLADESGGGPGRAAGAGASAGPGGQNQGTAAFRVPMTSVTAFLAALKAKDKDRLAQCTALHAPTESVEKHHKIFAAIVEGSISEDELDEMSKTLDGYQVSGMLEAVSSGRIGVLISKQQAGGDRLQRTVMTRKEKEGWKVLDVDNALEFKYIPTPRSRGGRRR